MSEMSEIPDFIIGLEERGVITAIFLSALEKDFETMDENLSAAISEVLSKDELSDIKLTSSQIDQVIFYIKMIVANVIERKLVEYSGPEIKDVLKRLESREITDEDRQTLKDLKRIPEFRRLIETLDID